SSSIAFGNAATASGAVSVAVGAGAVAAGISSTAMGDGAKALTFQSAAFGQNATVLAVNGTALGANAVVTATAFNSVARGQGSIANNPQTVWVGVPGGERRIQNVAPGQLGTDAVNVNQLTSAVTGLQQQITDVQREERRGIAAVTAAAFAPTPSG